MEALVLAGNTGWHSYFTLIKLIVELSMADDLGHTLTSPVRHKSYPCTRLY